MWLGLGQIKQQIEFEDGSPKAKLLWIETARIKFSSSELIKTGALAIIKRM